MFIWLVEMLWIWYGYHCYHCYHAILYCYCYHCVVCFEKLNQICEFGYSVCCCIVWYLLFVDYCCLQVLSVILLQLNFLTTYPWYLNDSFLLISSHTFSAAHILVNIRLHIGTTFPQKRLFYPQLIAFSSHPILASLLCTYWHCLLLASIIPNLSISVCSYT